MAVSITRWHWESNNKTPMPDLSGYTKSGTMKDVERLVTALSEGKKIQPESSTDTDVDMWIIGGEIGQELDVVFIEPVE